MPDRDGKLKHQGTFAADEETALLFKGKAEDASGSTWAWVMPLVVCIAWIGAGVGGMMVFEGWDPLTSLYVIAQIITTIGYGDITVSSDAAKVCVGIYVLGTLLVIGTVLTHLIDSFECWEQALLRAKLRQVEAAAGGAEATAKFGQYNELLTSLAGFLFFLIAGTVFYATYESCSCSYGVTGVEGCFPGKCAATGGHRLTWVESFYMSLITLTTVGFGDHSPKSAVGRAVGIVWMLLGVAATGKFVRTFGQLVLAQKKDQKRIDTVSHELFQKIDHNSDGELSRLEFRTYALIKFGMVTAKDLDEIDQLFRAIDKDGSGSLSYQEIMHHCDS